MVIKYIPVNFTDRSDCERKAQKYRVSDKRLGKGAYGTVYEACIGSECKYVLKEFEYNHELWLNTKAPKNSIQHVYLAWHHETSMHDELMACQGNSSLKFVPTIYDAWYCDPREQYDQPNTNAYFYILMEKYQGNLNDLANHFANNTDAVTQHMLTFTIETAIKNLREALGFIHHNCNICIKDIKLENILYKLSKYSLEFVYADFGLAEKNVTTLNSQQHKDCKKQDNEKLEREIQRFMSSFYRSE